jgi:hypothetical protein
MATFEKILLVVSLALAAYTAYTLVAGLYNGVLCYQSWCAHQGNPKENFGGLVFMYALIAAFGLVSAWRSHRNLKTISAGRKLPNTKF